MRYARRPPLSPALFTALLGLLASCGEQEPKVPKEPKLKKAGQSLAGVPAPLFFVPPPASAVPEHGRLWVPFRRGDAFPGELVTEIGARFDYLTFRLGGDQWVVEPETGPDGLGVRVEVGARRGGSLLGFTTVPRRVRVPEGDGFREVLLAEHGKLCLHVREGTWEEPAPSPAVAARFGFALEFAPVFDPLPILPGGELPVRLRFGTGLEGAEVVAEQIPLGGDGEPVEVFRGRTGAEGHFVLPVTRAGLWRLRAHYEEPAASDGDLPCLHRATLVFRTGER